METDEVRSGYAQKVGLRLRSVRKQKGLSLQEVEAQSTQEFKASVLGAYERGERAISVPRLQRLARFYAVPVDRLLPDDMTGTLEFVDVRRDETARTNGAADVLTLDLAKLQQLDEPALAPLQRFVTMIQLQRQDYNGRVLTLRRDDVRALACLVDASPDSLRRRLDDLGLRVSTPTS